MLAATLNRSSDLGDSSTDLIEAGTSPAAIGGVLSNAPAALYPECALSNADPLPGADWAKGYGDGNSGVETRWAHQPAEQSVRAACGLKLQDAITNAANLPTDFPGLTLPTYVELPVSVVEAASARISQQGGSLSEVEMRHVLAEAGWPEGLFSEALAVSFCESRHSPAGKGDISNHPEQMGVPMSRGLFQMGAAGYRWLVDPETGIGRWVWWIGWFRYFGYSDDDAYDPVTNATVARLAYERSGWAPWSCRTAVY